MHCKLILKEKPAERVIYYYCADSSTYPEKFEDIVPDGEIECVFVPGQPGAIKCTTLVRATNDESGRYAEWLYNHMWRTVIVNNCPERRVIATG